MLPFFGVFHPSRAREGDHPEGAVQVAARTAFVSFDVERDLNAKMQFYEEAARLERPAFALCGASAKSDLPEMVWEEEVFNIIGQCQMMIVLVGPFMRTAYSVMAEITMAQDHRVPLIGVYVNGAGPSSQLPTGLPREWVVPWRWPDIAAAVERCADHRGSVS